MKKLLLSIALLSGAQIVNAAAGKADELIVPDNLGASIVAGITRSLELGSYSSLMTTLAPILKEARTAALNNDIAQAQSLLKVVEDRLAADPRSLIFRVQVRRIRNGLPFPGYDGLH